MIKVFKQIKNDCLKKSIKLIWSLEFLPRLLWSSELEETVISNLRKPESH